MNKTRQLNYSKEELSELSALCKSLSVDQDFRTIGDDLSSHDSAMVMAGVRAAGRPIPAATPAPADPTIAKAKKRVKVIRDENGAITGFEQD